MRNPTPLAAALSLLCAAYLTATPAHTTLVEAEAFADPGGWVLDAQFMQQMGSP